MKKIIVLTLYSAILSCGIISCTQPKECGVIVDMVEYKKIDTITLDMMVMTPDNITKGEKRAAVVFIHGGGWNNGSYKSFESHGKYLASKGLVAFSISYRIKNKHKTTPYEALLDAKSAMRFIRANAEHFSIDPDKIISAGGSAGGHLAAAVTVCTDINDHKDDISVSSKSAAAILFNPVICNGPDTLGKYKGYAYDRVANYYKEFSPIHNIRKDVPPTIFMIGTEDHLIPIEVAKEYKRLIEEVGGRCDLHIYDGQKHGFYHISKNSNVSNFYNTMTDVHNFLVDLDYLETAPTVGKWLDSQNNGYTYE